MLPFFFLYEQVKDCREFYGEGRIKQMRSTMLSSPRKTPKRYKGEDSDFEDDDENDDEEVSEILTFQIWR